MIILTTLGIISLALLGVPLFAILTLGALCAFSFSGIPLSALPLEIYRVASWPTLTAIPLFALAGHLLANSKSPERILRVAQASLGHLPGGLAILALAVCALFTAFTGASGITIVALGGLLYPMLKAHGYSENFSLGLVTTSGSLGLLFPPALPIILYGIVARVDIDRLFLAGIVPGCLILGILSLYALKNRPTIQGPGRDSFEIGEFFSALRASVFELLLPVAILVAIYGGYTTVTEAASFTAFAVLVLVCFIRKDLSLTRDVPRLVGESMALVGAILLILCCALGLTNYFIDEEIPTRIFHAAREVITHKYLFLLFLNIFLLLVGAVMDIFSAIVVVVPLILPIAAEFGVHPIHLAMIFLTNMEIGFITPPIGINLFISSATFKAPVARLYRASFPYVVLLLVALLLITYIPTLSLLWEQ